MCTVELVIGGLLSAGGAYVQNQAQQDAVKKQQRIVSQAEENQNRRQHEQQNLLLADAMKFDPATRQDSMNAEAAKIEQGIGQALAETNSAAPQADSGATGNVSAEYAKARADSVANETAKAADMARMMSRVRAPTDMMGNENLEYMNTLSRIGDIGSKMKGEWSSQMARAQGVRPNGGTMMLGDAMRAGGSMLGASGDTLGGLFGGAASSPTHLSMMGGARTDPWSISGVHAY